jgi:hypothetical protein
MPVSRTPAGPERALIRLAPGVIRDRQPTQIHAKEQI